MSYNLGINVVEVDGRVAPSIQAAPTSVTGFIVLSQRGVPGAVRKVTSWSQFLEQFGAHTATANGAYAVQGFFDNGGNTAYVTRVVNTTPGTASAASVLSSGGPWALEDGGVLILNAAGMGPPLTATFNGAAAQVTAGAGDFELITGPQPDTLSVVVNGISAGSYTFVVDDADNLEEATAAEVADVLNREFRGIQAWVDDGDGLLRIRTDRRGDDARLAFTGTAAAKLGLPVGVTSGSGNVKNLDAVTTGEALGVIAAAFEDLEVLAEGSSLRIRHPNTGAANTLQFTDDPDSMHARFGFNLNAVAGVNGNQALAAVAATRPFAAGPTLDALVVTAAFRGTDDPGGWGMQVAVRIAPTVGDAQRFDLTVRYQGRVVETWERLGMVGSAERFVSDVVNDEFSGSRFIRVTPTDAVVPNPTPPLVDGGFVALQDGSDGGFVDDDATVAALAAAVPRFENVDIQLLCCPEHTGPELVNAALAHCENKNDRMFLGHTPQDTDAPDIRESYSQQFQGQKVYGALYFPWIQVARPGGGRRWVPPTGHVAGMYARTDRERGVWKAPAGNAARLNGALDVRFHVSDTDHTDLVKNGSVNAVRYLPGQGIIVDSSRTLSTSTLWLYVNVRLLFNLVKSSLKTGLRWVVQEPNHPDLWNKIKYNTVNPFLMGLWRRGAFGPGAAEDVFTVKVDADNNKAEDIQQGRLTVEVYFYPSRPAETIVVTVGQQEGAGSANES
jgi:uncharacterized protein